jgi:hypothetical protein
MKLKITYFYLFSRMPTNEVMSVFMPAICSVSMGFQVLFVSLLAGLPLVIGIVLLYTKMMLFNKLMINKARFTPC